MIYHRAKIQKKLTSHFWEKRRADRRTEEQTDNDDFIGPSVGRGSNRGEQIIYNLSSDD